MKSRSNHKVNADQIRNEDSVTVLHNKWDMGGCWLLYLLLPYINVQILRY